LCRQGLRPERFDERRETDPMAVWAKVVDATRYLSTACEELRNEPNALSRSQRVNDVHGETAAMR
jgi:hypothetical protein